MDESKLKDVLYQAMEASLEAQLRAVRRLRSGEEPAPKGRPRQGMSQVDMAHDILKSAGRPLHISDIIDRIATRFHQQPDRESLVSALSKKVLRKDRFTRTGKNEFSLLKGGQ
jgi:hypothetical protein